MQEFVRQWAFHRCEYRQTELEALPLIQLQMVLITTESVLLSRSVRQSPDIESSILRWRRYGIAKMAV